MVKKIGNMRNGRKYSERMIRNFKHNLKYLRERGRMTKAQLARELGYSPSYVTMLEGMGSRKKPGMGISLETLAHVAHFFGTTPGRILDAEYPFELFQ